MARTGKKKAQYEASTLATYAVAGIVIIALGAVSLLSVVGGLRGALFTQVKWVMQGLGGGLCLGVSLLMVASGVLVAFSSSRSMPKRGILLITLFYLAVLAVVNLLSGVRQTPLMDYLVALNRNATPPAVHPESFLSMLEACWRVCSNNGAFGGTLGMLLAWPAYTFLGRTLGTVALVLLCVVCVLLFSRFDVLRVMEAVRAGAAARSESRRQRRAQQEQERLAQEERARQEQNEQSLKTPAFRRRDAAEPQAPPMQPYAPYGGMSQPGYAPPGYAAPPAQPPLYDEIIIPQEKQLPWRKNKKADKPEPFQTRMTFTPSEMGVAQDPQPAAAQSRNRTLAYVETVSRRKADAAQPPPQPAPPPQTAQPDPQEAYKRPAGAKAPPTQNPPAYVYPSVDLLNPAPKHVSVDTRDADEENAARLEKTLESFSIPARVQRVTHGPAVTRFELGFVSGGINVKRVANIADNIALDMAANGGVRVEEHIMGTNLFGIEVPNKEIQSVSFAEVLLSPEMKAAESPLAVALGKDIAGRPVICDIAKMPHLLIAGQTGSGKSVCVNAIINSILFRSSPEEVRMIMIDPKVVELQGYNEVPHLLIPVISDPRKASGALAWAVAEMLDRYHKMKSKNAREFSAYNAKLSPGEEKLPRILIIIDELADLMMACKKEVEQSIIRLAQLARAAGIHIIVATQRPTVDVVTGLIKTNIPSRIAFSMSSAIDSRTILDQNGAEKLLGRGDMIYFPTGASMPLRVQGCYLSDAEIERVVEHIARHSQTAFDPNVIEAIENEDGDANPLEGETASQEADDLLPKAIEMVITDGQASISMLQRRMKIGYARAGRLIDDMAARGIISQSAGSKPREVLMSREEYESVKDSLLGAGAKGEQEE